MKVFEFKIVGKFIMGFGVIKVFMDEMVRLFIKECVIVIDKGVFLFGFFD